MNRFVSLALAVLAVSQASHASSVLTARQEGATILDICPSKCLPQQRQHVACTKREIDCVCDNSFQVLLSQCYACVADTVQASPEEFPDFSQWDDTYAQGQLNSQYQDCLDAGKPIDRQLIGGGSEPAPTLSSSVAPASSTVSSTPAPASSSARQSSGTASTTPASSASAASAAASDTSTAPQPSQSDAALGSTTVSYTVAAGALFAALFL